MIHLSEKQHNYNIVLTTTNTEMALMQQRIP